jgi:hypothetical protein
MKRETTRRADGFQRIVASVRLLLALAAVAALIPACHDADEVTGPGGRDGRTTTSAPPTGTPTLTPTADPNPTVTLTATAVPPTPVTPTATPLPQLNLAGDWRGTMHESPQPGVHTCAGGDRPVRAHIEQNGANLQITISSGFDCFHDDPTMAATLEGSTLSGTLSSLGAYKGDDCSFSGNASGTASPVRIDLNGSMKGWCIGVDMTIELTR